MNASVNLVGEEVNIDTVTMTDDGNYMELSAGPLIITATHEQMIAIWDEMNHWFKLETTEHPSK